MKIRKFSEAADSGKEFEEFADAREAGAEKIANKAHEKGGPALLTWHHFKVKLPYYKEFDETYKKISSDMDQIEFQREVGRLEVLGELLIKSRKKK